MFLKFLHLAQIFIMAFIGARLYLSYKEDDFKNRAIRDLAVFFLVFSLYQTFLSTIIFTENESIIIYSYSASMPLFFIMLVIAWRIPFLLFGIDLKKINLKIFKTSWCGGKSKKLVFNNVCRHAWF